MRAAIESFLTFLLAERGASVNTVMAYGRDLRQMADYLCRRLDLREEAGWDAVDEAAVAEFMRHLRGRGYKSSSVARKVTVIRRFFAFLAARGMVATSPATSLSAPRRAEPRRTLATEDVQRLSDHLAWSGTPEAKRDRAILELLWSTGMRVSELVALDMSGLDLGPSPSVSCCAGGARARIVPIHVQAARALRLYIAEARPVLVLDREETAVFVNWRGQRLSRQGVWLNVRKHALAAGLASGAAPSALRSSFASRKLGDGVPLRYVHEMLGHADGSASRSHAARDHSPLDRLILADNRVATRA